MAFPNSVYRRGRYFDGGTADQITLEAGGTKSIMVDSTLAVVEIVFTPKAATGCMHFLKASRIVATCAGFEVGYNAGSGLLLFVAGNATTATSYLACKCSWTPVLDRTYRITFTYLADTVYTIVIDELAADGSTVNTTSPTVTTELGTSYVTDTGIAYDVGSYQDVSLGEANANSMLGNKVSSGFKGTGWAGGAGSNPVNGVIHGISIERVTAGVAACQLLLNEQLAATAPVDATGNNTPTLGAAAPAVVAAELTVTELVSGDAVTDTDDYAAGALGIAETLTVRVTNTGDSVAWIDTITDAGGDLGLTSVHTTPCWLYPGDTLDLVFTQAGEGGTGGATVEAYGASGTDSDWADDVTPFGSFQVSLTYSLPTSVCTPQAPRGYAAGLLLREESAWGVFDTGIAQVSVRTPIVSESIRVSQTERGIIHAIETGSRPASVGGVGRQSIMGEIQTELCVNGWGALLLKHATGSAYATVADGDHYTHAGQTGALPTGLTVDKALVYPDGTVFNQRFLGCRVGSLAVELQRGQPVQMRAQIVGKSRTTPAAPTTWRYAAGDLPLFGNEFVVRLDRDNDGVAEQMANITRAQFTIDNGLNRGAFAVENGALIDRLPQGQRTVSGRIEGFWVQADEQILDLWTGNTPIAMTLIGWMSSDPSQYAQFDFPAIHLRDTPVPQVAGRGLVRFNFGFVCGYSDALGYDFAWTIKSVESEISSGAITRTL